MKAIVLEKYGSTKNLAFKEISRIKIKEDELLIKMKYTSINSADLDFIYGHPLVRFTGLFKPGYPILGSDCVGFVEEVGSQVSRFEIGDKVWADLSNPLSYGTFAQYVSVPASSIQKIPFDIDLKEAACLPTAAMVALQNVQLKQKPKKDHKVLVNGAGGEIGTILVQCLKALEVEFTAVDKKEKHTMLRELGAKFTIDYREINYTQQEQQYDYVYDLLCTNKLSNCLSVVKKNGHLIMLGGSTRNLLAVLVFGPIISLISRRKVKLGRWDTNNHDDLYQLAKLNHEGIIKPVIDSVILLEETIKGLETLESGIVQGKIVVKNN